MAYQSKYTGAEIDAGIAAANSAATKEYVDAAISGIEVSDGEDGVSPVVTVEEITGGHRVKITDAIGTHSFDVMDGTDGSGDMLMSVYDADGDGVVDNATMLGGKTSDQYASADHTHTASEVGSVNSSDFEQLSDDVSEIADEVDGFVEKLTSPFEEKDTVVSCNPVEGYPLGVVTEFEPKQEGSGDPSPDNIRPINGWTGAKLTRCGKNLLKNNGQTETENGLTFTVNSDGSVRVNGTSTADTWYRVSADMGLPAGEYILNGNTGGAAYKYFLYVSINGQTAGNRHEEVRFTVSDGDTNTAYFVAYAGVTFNNHVFYPMVRLASITDASYEPYHADTYTADFGQTVYGGELDWDTGVLTVTHGMINAYSGETLPGVWISDRDVYADGTTPSTGAQIAYELATPTTIQLTPQEILALKGENTLYSDIGKTIVSGRISPEWMNEQYAKKSEIPDTSKFITNAVNDLVNYYRKSESYTRDEIDNRLNKCVSPTITVDQTDQEIILTITDVNGTQTVSIPLITDAKGELDEDAMFEILNRWYVLNTLNDENGAYLADENGHVLLGNDVCAADIDVSEIDKRIDDKINASKPADYIIEAGTSGIWQYEKWNSGKAVCIGTYKEKKTEYTTVGTFHGYYSSNVPYPTGLFVSPPVMMHSSKVGNGFVIDGGDVRNNAAYAAAYALCTATGEVDCTWNFYCVGRWK